jgi:hypothetical protein
MQKYAKLEDTKVNLHQEGIKMIFRQQKKVMKRKYRKFLGLIIIN